MKKRLSREIWAWCTFDVANSSYSTLIISVAFSVIYAQLIVAGGDPARYEEGNALWSRWLALSWALSGILGPLLGAYTDRTRRKRALLRWTVVLCCLFCGSLYFVVPGDWLMAGVLIVLSNLCYSLTEITIASFLPSLVDKEDLGSISGLGWSLGYLGGLASLLLAFSVTGFDYRLENMERLSLLGPLTAIFFFVASLPTLVFLREPPLSQSEDPNSEDHGVRSALCVVRSDRRLLRFLACYFLIHGGVMIAVSFASLFGSQVAGVVGGEQAIFFLCFQIVAALGAFGFGRVTQRLGNLKTLEWNLVLWLIAIGLMTDFVYFQLAATFGKKIVFYCAGICAGLSLGATLSNSRALVSGLTPDGMGGRILSLWGMTGCAASVVSVFLFGYLQTHFRLTTSLYFVLILFLIPLFALRKIGKDRL